MLKKKMGFVGYIRSWRDSLGANKGKLSPEVRFNLWTFYYTQQGTWLYRAELLSTENKKFVKYLVDAICC